MSKYHGLEVGQVKTNKQGHKYEILEINGCKDVKIRFLERGWEKTTTAHYAHTGCIRLPKYIVGDIVKDKNGEDVEIVEIVNSGHYVFQWKDGYKRSCQSSAITLGTLMREEDSCRLNPRVQVGMKFKNLQGVEFEVLERKSNSEVLVKFLTDSGYEVLSNGGNIIKGVVHYPFAPTVAGVGIVGLFPVNTHEYQYTSWCHMLNRVYNPTTEQSKITYEGCSVRHNWHWLECFHDWASKQVYQKGWHLDKDLLIKGNREYSEDSCIYLPFEVNVFMTDRANHRGNWPVGVTYHERINKYQATCNVFGESQYLGVYTSAEEAFYVYKARKELFAKELAAKWRGVIDPKAYEALMNYEVSITD